MIFNNYINNDIIYLIKKNSSFSLNYFITVQVFFWYFLTNFFKIKIKNDYFVQYYFIEKGFIFAIINYQLLHLCEFYRIWKDDIYNPQNFLSFLSIIPQNFLNKVLR